MGCSSYMTHSTSKMLVFRFCHCGTVASAARESNSRTDLLRTLSLTADLFYGVVPALARNRAFVFTAIAHIH